MFAQTNIRIRQSNTSAIFTGFGQMLNIGELAGEGFEQTAPAIVPAGTEFQVVAQVATADHFNLFLLACKLPDGTVKGMALRPLPFDKLIAVLEATPPVLVVEGETTPEAPTEVPVSIEVDVTPETEVTSDEAQAAA